MPVKDVSCNSPFQGSYSYLGWNNLGPKQELESITKRRKLIFQCTYFLEALNGPLEPRGGGPIVLALGV